MSEVKTDRVANMGSDLQLITDSYEISQILDHIGHNHDDEYGCAFVDTADGEYTEVWACMRSTPWMHATVYKLR